jgi:hypothetical protein
MAKASGNIKENEKKTTSKMKALNHQHRKA